jgi:predicted site-specific integrase-resolvase
MKIGYARVSTDNQNPALQIAALKWAGCKRIFTDTASGASRKRPQLDKCLKALKAGDVLTVRWSVLSAATLKAKINHYQLKVGSMVIWLEAGSQAKATSPTECG